MRTHIIDGIEIHTSSDNVFADLGLPDAQSLNIKTGLVAEIMRAIRRLDLHQANAAQRMGISPPPQTVCIAQRRLQRCA